MSEDDAETSEDLGSLRLDVAGRRTQLAVASPGLWSSATVATGLHVGVIAALLMVEPFRGFGDRDIATASIAVEIVSASFLDAGLRPEAAKAGADTTESRAASAAPEAPAPAAIVPDPPRNERPESPPAPDAAEKTAAPEAAEQPTPIPLADRETSARATEQPKTERPPTEPAATETASTPSQAADDATKGSEAPMTGDAPPAPALAVAPAAGGGTSAYGTSVLETLRRRPPRPAGGLRGRVLIAFSIDATGRVAAARVKSSSGSIDLDTAALDVVRATRFPVPPANVSPSELAYEVPYIFR